MQPKQKKHQRPSLRKSYQHAVEIQEILLRIREHKTENIMHAAKIQRLGEQHVQRAKSLTSKAKAEVMQAKRGTNFNKKMA